MLTTAGLVTIATIISGAIPVGGILLYGLGVLHPLRTKATWKPSSWKPDEAKPEEFAALVVRIKLKNRKKSTQTLNNLALIDDPGWPRRLRSARREVPSVPFTHWHGDDPASRLELEGGDARTVSAVLKGVSITSADAAGIAQALAAVALPFAHTRLLIQMSDRNFYAKLVRESIPASPPPPLPAASRPAEPNAGGGGTTTNAPDAAKDQTTNGQSKTTGQ